MSNITRRGRAMIGALCGAACAISVPASAQDAIATATEPAADNIATPAMWRATDADTEVILLGTFHILPPNVDWRTTDIETAFEKSNVVYFEAETDTREANRKAIFAMNFHGKNPDGKLLTDILDPAAASKMQNIAASLNINLGDINQMRPWNAFLTLSYHFIVNQGFDPASGVDRKLLKEARRKKKIIRYFETVDEQFALFTGLDPDTEKDLLELTVRNWEQEVLAFDGLFKAWKFGDTQIIDRDMNENMQKQTPEVFERLIVARNKNWAEEISRVMKTETGTIFIAVGAAHLVGDQSVPAMLAAEGFSVDRYDAAGALGAATVDEPAPIGDPANDNIAPVQEPLLLAPADDGKAADDTEAPEEEAEEESDAIGNLLKAMEEAEED